MPTQLTQIQSLSLCLAVSLSPSLLYLYSEWTEAYHSFLLNNNKHENNLDKLYKQILPEVAQIALKETTYVFRMYYAYTTAYIMYYFYLRLLFSILYKTYFDINEIIEIQ